MKKEYGMCKKSWEVVHSWNYLKGIAALLIMGLHYWFNYLRPNLSEIEMHYYRTFFGAGGSFVDSFTILTGLFTITSIASISEEKYSFWQSLQWLLKRFSRWYVLYAVICLYYYGFLIQNYKDVLRALLFLRIVPAGWPLPFYAWFYFMGFVALLFSIKKYRVLVYFSLLLFFTNIFPNFIVGVFDEVPSYGQILFSPLFAGFLQNADISYIYSIITGSYMNVFIWSFALYALWFHGGDMLKIQPLRAKVLIGFTIFVYIFGSYWPVRSHNSVFQWGVYSFLLLMALLIFEKSVNFRKIRVLNFFGNISLPVYLLHDNVMSSLSLSLSLSLYPIHFHDLQCVNHFNCICLLYDRSEIYTPFY